MKSNICINVEFMAGTDVEEAVKEAKEKAGHWDVAYVCFIFNGMPFSIGKNADIEDAIQQWKKKRRKPTTSSVVVA